MLSLFYSLSLIFVGLVIVIKSFLKLNDNKFFEDTPWLFILGIYIWGDGLVLGFFWLIMGLLTIFLPAIWLYRLVLIFFALRWFYEVIYWLNHQAHKRSFKPFFLQGKKTLPADQAAIVYQLIHLCLTTLALFGLWLSF